MTRYTHKQKKAVLEAYRSGMSAPKAAKVAGVKEGSARVWIRKAGLSRSSHEATMLAKDTPERRERDERIRFLYERCGLTTWEVADVVGVGQLAVRRALVRQGVELRPMAKRRPKFYEKRDRIIMAMIAERGSGTTWPEIGRMFGYTSRHCERLVKAHRDRLVHGRKAA